MSDDPISGLLAGVADGDRAAFRELYSAASAKLFGTCLRILKNRAEAEDALQDVFTRVWTRAHRYDPQKARGMTWMIVIARNHCIDRLRARPSQTDGDEALAFVADAKPGVEAQLVAAGEARRINQCFDTLETDRAAAVRGAYLDGLSYEQLSARFEVPLNTMRSWLRRGLLKLKECLEA
jgi:RNA polymerase sigma-70 factor (ECF subfamily)